MFLASFSELHTDRPEQARVGLLIPRTREIVDLAQLEPDLPTEMISLISLGYTVFPSLEIALQSGKARIPLDDIKLLAPIPVPSRNIFCVGKNYPDHVKEVQSVLASEKDRKGDAPTSPIIFTKAPSSVIGPMDPIPAWLDETESVDYEGELAVIIGKGGRKISQTNAMDHVYGYTILNDVTSRRMQKKHQQWFLGKSLDGFCPMGPCLVTKDEIKEVTELHVQTHVNGELRQDGYVGEMIFSIPVLIETLSNGITLECGDIIATGTPAGVGMGFKPPRFLKAGDKVSISIDPIGTLENPVE